jgi:hypothetical protein
MSKTRASIFGDDDLDLSGFAPKAPTAEEIKPVAEASNFRSREPVALAPAPLIRQPRRYRTGRNMQLNIKATAETIADFNAICDRHRWVAGETLQRALDALKRELGGSNEAGKSDA